MSEVEFVMFNKAEAALVHTGYYWDNEDEEGIDEYAEDGITIPVIISNLMVEILPFAQKRRYVCVDFKARVYDGKYDYSLDSIDEDSILVQVCDKDVERWTAEFCELDIQQQAVIVSAITANGDAIALSCLHGYSPCAREYKKYVEDCQSDYI